MIANVYKCKCKCKCLQMHVKVFGKYNVKKTYNAKPPPANQRRKITTCKKRCEHSGPWTVSSGHYQELVKHCRAV